MVPTHVSEPESSYSRELSLSCFLVALGLLLLLAGALPLHADTITLKSGRVLEGKVVSQGETLVIELPGGIKVSVAASDVEKVVAGQSPVEQLAVREARLPIGEAGAAYDLALWCKNQRLTGEHTRLLWRVLDLDPHHEAARETLGFQRLGALWLQSDDYQRALGKVRHGKQWVTRQELWQLEQQEASQARFDQADQLFRRAASKGPEVERQSALAELRDLPASLRRRALLKGSESLSGRERQFAVRELGVLADHGQHATLAHMAVSDGKRSVRDEALRVLKDWGHPDTALSFIPYLDSGDQRQRVNAARALNVFPDVRATGPLIERASRVVAGFGRAHFMNVVQRSYVKDYELVSGGTGLVVQEVADPVVDTFQEGVVLDVDVRRVEMVSLIATLQRTSGQSFGMNVNDWQRWWAQQTGKPRTPAQEAEPEKS